jgi:hypothetical protein
VQHATCHLCATVLKLGDQGAGELRQNQSLVLALVGIGVATVVSATSPSPMATKSRLATPQ